MSEQKAASTPVRNPKVIAEVRRRLDEPGMHGVECARLAQAVRAVLDMHSPTYEAAGKTWTNRVIVPHDEIGQVEGHVCVIGGALDQVCVPGEEHAVEACSECRTWDEHGESAEFIWPCPTVQTVVGALATEWVVAEVLADA